MSLVLYVIHAHPDHGLTVGHNQVNNVRFIPIVQRRFIWRNLIYNLRSTHVGVATRRIQKTFISDEVRDNVSLFRAPRLVAGLIGGSNPISKDLKLQFEVLIIGVNPHSYPAAAPPTQRQFSANRVNICTRLLETVCVIKCSFLQGMAAGHYRRVRR